MPALNREEALRELGRLAAERREEARLSLQDIYERTRIRIEFLNGIEEGNYENFPDVVYIKGFVRTYLNIIGASDLQPEFLSVLSKAMTNPAVDPASVLGNVTTPAKGFKPVSHFWLFVVLVTALTGTGIYAWYVWKNNGLTSPFMRNNQVIANEALSGDADPAKNSLSGDIKHLEVLPVSEEPVIKPKPKPKPSLLIKAKNDVWMSVKTGDKVIYSKTLKKGSEISWDITADISVTYARPGAVLVTHNGKELGEPNPKGGKKSETYTYSPDGTNAKAKSKP